MPNPFTDKSLRDLIDMAPALSDPELDGLAAEYCETGAISLSKFWILDGRWYHPTTDGREAGRLLVKYRMEFTWYENCPEAAGCVGPSPGRRYEFKKSEECRAIAKAALSISLTEAIEGGKKDPMP